MHTDSAVNTLVEIIDEAKIRDDILERFPRYCERDSGSLIDQDIVPSTSEQVIFLQELVAEAREWGYEVEYLRGGLMIRVKSNVGFDVPRAINSPAPVTSTEISESAHLTTRPS